MTLKEYYSKDTHTRKEIKAYNKIMREKYEKYKKAYHSAKLEYRTRTAEKYTFKHFKEAYEYMYVATDGRSNLKSMLKQENFATLSEDSYEQKRRNLIDNINNYKAKADSGIPLSQGEQLVVNTDPYGNIHKIVAYFDKLGLAHTAFDSPGSAESN